MPWQNHWAEYSKTLRKWPFSHWRVISTNWRPPYQHKNIYPVLSRHWLSSFLVWWYLSHPQPSLWARTHLEKSHNIPRRHPSLLCIRPLPVSSKAKRGRGDMHSLSFSFRTLQADHCSALHHFLFAHSPKCFGHSGQQLHIWFSPPFLWFLTSLLRLMFSYDSQLPSALSNKTNTRSSWRTKKKKHVSEVTFFFAMSGGLEMQGCVIITSVAAVDLSGQVGFREDLATCEIKTINLVSCACLFWQKV